MRENSRNEEIVIGWCMTDIWRFKEGIYRPKVVKNKKMTHTRIENLGT